MTENYKSWDFFVAIGNADRRQKIFEILNEKDKDDVYRNVVAWINTVI